MTETLRRLQFWFGEVIGDSEGEQIWESSEAMDNQLAQHLFTNLNAMVTPPVISLSATPDAVDVAPFSGWSNAWPLFQISTQAVSYALANAGAIIGATTPTPGFSRTVVILARYSTVGAVPIIDRNDVPGFQELHHAVEYRVMQTTDTLPVGLAIPSGYNAEVDGGSVPVAVVLRTASGDTLYPISHSSVIRPGLMLPQWLQARASMYLNDGLMIQDILSNSDNTSPPTLTSVVTGGGYAVKLSGDPASALRWVTSLGGLLMTWNCLDDAVEQYELVTGDLMVGTNTIRLRWQGFPTRPLLYAGDGSNLPSAADEKMDPAPAGLIGTAHDVLPLIPGAFPTTVEDLCIGLAVYNGVDPPTLTPLANPGRVEFYEDINANYTSENSRATGALVQTITPPGLCGREWEVSSVEWGEVDEGHGDVPANRGASHNLQVRVLYQDFTQVVLEVWGEWYDTSSGLSVPGTLRYFRPPCRVNFALKAPAKF